MPLYHSPSFSLSIVTVTSTFPRYLVPVLIPPSRLEKTSPAYATSGVMPRSSSHERLVPQSPVACSHCHHGLRKPLDSSFVSSLIRCGAFC